MFNRPWFSEECNFWVEKWLHACLHTCKWTCHLCFDEKIIKKIGTYLGHTGTYLVWDVLVPILDERNDRQAGCKVVIYGKTGTQ